MQRNYLLGVGLCRASQKWVAGELPRNQGRKKVLKLNPQPAVPSTRSTRPDQIWPRVDFEVMFRRTCLLGVGLFHILRICWWDLISPVGVASLERLFRTRVGIDDDARQVVAVTSESEPTSMPTRTAVDAFSTAIFVSSSCTRGRSSRQGEGLCCGQALLRT